MRTRIPVGLACVALCFTLGCGGGGGGDGTPTTPNTPNTPSTPITPASPNEVLVQNNVFNPAALTVPAGTTVRWRWATCSGGSDPYGGGVGETCVDHNVTWDVGGTASALQSEGTYQLAFNTPGTYTYHCAVHGAAMAGRIVVP